VYVTNTIQNIRKQLEYSIWIHGYGFGKIRVRAKYGILVEINGISEVVTDDI
jgi:hypothetical protein